MYIGILEPKQKSVDRFYKKNGPCCAGCDWWRFFNSSVGECIKTVPVSGEERIAMIDITGLSFTPGAGHIMTQRHHLCGQFKDDFDWSTIK